MIYSVGLQQQQQQNHPLKRLARCSHRLLGHHRGRRRSLRVLPLDVPAQPEWRPIIRRNAPTAPHVDGVLPDAHVGEGDAPWRVRTPRRRRILLQRALAASATRLQNGRRRCGWRHHRTHLRGAPGAGDGVGLRGFSVAAARAVARPRNRARHVSRCACRTRAPCAFAHHNRYLASRFRFSLMHAPGGVISFSLHRSAPPSPPPREPYSTITFPAPRDTSSSPQSFERRFARLVHEPGRDFSSSCSSNGTECS